MTVILYASEVEGKDFDSHLGETICLFMVAGKEELVSELSDEGCLFTCVPLAPSHEAGSSGAIGALVKEF